MRRASLVAAAGNIAAIAALLVTLGCSGTPSGGSDQAPVTRALSIADGENWSEQVIENASLAGLTLYDMNFRYSVFSNVDLTDFVCNYCDFYGARFEGVNMTNAKFADSVMMSMKIIGVSGSGVEFTDTEFNGSDFRDAELRQAVFRDVPVLPETLRGSDLTGATFEDVSGTRVDFRETVLDGATFKNADIGSPDFRGASMLTISLLGRTEFWYQADYRGVLQFRPTCEQTNTLYISDIDFAFGQEILLSADCLVLLSRFTGDIISGEWDVGPGQPVVLGDDGD